MGITSALVLFAVIWFMTFLIVIPFNIETQGDLGDVVEGTQAGAPENHHLRKKGMDHNGHFRCDLGNSGRHYCFGCNYRG